MRGVLCNNCNGIEGKIFNLANRAKRDGTVSWFLERVIGYWKCHSDMPSGIYHPMHRTLDEKKALKNKRARLKRKRTKK